MDYSDICANEKKKETFDCAKKKKLLKFVAAIVHKIDTGGAVEGDVSSTVNGDGFCS